MDLCRRGYTVVGRPGVECLDRSKRLPKPETTKAYADMNTQLFVLLARRPLLAGFRLLFTADRERVKRADAARNALVRAVGANAGPIQRLAWEKALARNLQQCRAERTQLVWRIAIIDCAVQTLHAHCYTEIIHACGIASILDQLPYGDETILEEDCALSRDHQKRIGLARALYADAPVILLDGVPASADIFDRAVVGLASGKCRIVATRIPAVLRQCGRVVTLRDGRFEEEYSPKLDSQSLRDVIQGVAAESDADADDEQYVVPSRTGFKLEDKKMNKESGWRSYLKAADSRMLIIVLGMPYLGTAMGHLWIFWSFGGAQSSNGGSIRNDDRCIANQHIPSSGRLVFHAASQFAFFVGMSVITERASRGLYTNAATATILETSRKALGRRRRTELLVTEATVLDEPFPNQLARLLLMIGRLAASFATIMVAAPRVILLFAFAAAIYYASSAFSHLSHAARPRRGPPSGAPNQPHSAGGPQRHYTAAVSSLTSSVAGSATIHAHGAESLVVAELRGRLDTWVDARAAWVRNDTVATLKAGAVGVAALVASVAIALVAAASGGGGGDKRDKLAARFIETWRIGRSPVAA
ncbi:Multidrug resistance-associated protein 9 [Lasiodiplodia theobromae]|uniref:Multidrug resistance-associated protein 9 n=1 Tax=Lasiodiplodia theobromae TaxID=45133 RepID=A0A5N5D232_9PEZI|nr:Multidrug resistance-associated protein 9 [Lasiodiplodia theobromae]